MSGQEIAAKQGRDSDRSGISTCRREAGREFRAVGPDAQKDRSPTVFNLKVGTSKVGKSDDLKARTGV